MSRRSHTEGIRSWDPVNSLKGRIAEALVENILNQAGYNVCRLGRESQMQYLLKTQRSEFLPDFLVWKELECPTEPIRHHRLLSVEVKFRSDLKEYLRPREIDELVQEGVKWPELYLVLVTDRPDRGRSCFQLLDLREFDPDTPLATMDLHEARALGIGK